MGPTNTTAGGIKQAVSGSTLPPGTVCVQWTWADVGGSGCAVNNRFASDAANTEGTREDDEGLDELYPARTAFVLLGPPPTADDGNGDGGRSGPSIIVTHVIASKVDGLRRRASQLKVS